MAIINIFNSRNVNGTYTSPVKLIPSNLTTMPVFRFPIRSDHYVDPSKTVTIEVQLSDNGTTGWWTKAKYVREGRIQYDKGGNEAIITPLIQFLKIESFRGKYIRIIVTTNSLVNISSEVET